jgi:peptide/nickel transport system permease protein
MFYVIKRILATIPVMVVVALFVFCIIRLGPGDPASVIAGDYATAEDIQEIRIKLGLADPIPVQMGKWFVQLASGDLGKSYHSNMQVTKLISQ